LHSVWCPYYYEAWGLVLNEAMQFGKPVITTDAVGSAPDLIKNGSIVKNNDVESLYQAIKTIAKDPQMAIKMGI
jgi:glycosyltransferase involved in cell wall biosynthesis